MLISAIRAPSTSTGDKANADLNSPDVRRVIMDVLAEFCFVARRIGTWGTLAWFDTKFRYRRTTIGPLWITLSTGVTVLAVGFVYGQIFGHPTGTTIAGYMAYFAVGTVLWAFVSTTISQACVVFSQSGGLIKALPVPLLLHVFRMIARNIVLLAHNALIIVMLWVVFRWSVDWRILLCIPGLILLVLTLFGTAVALGILGTRFRDIEQIVAALLQLMFLITPILWLPSVIRNTPASPLLDLNPAYYMIEVVRAPLLGEVADLKIWIGAVLIAAAALLCGLGLYGRFRHRLSYWL
jgi:ABC-type polysaccharide/polyol phosphate export permease